MNVDPTKELEKLVSFDSVSSRQEKLKPAVDCPNYINSRLEEMGFITDLLENNGYYSTLARKGQGKFKIMFLAHFDVVPPGDGWNTDPFSLQIDGDNAYGRGAADDKGNIVSLLMLADMFRESELPCTVMISTTGDEEIGGGNGARPLRDYLIKNGLFPNYLVIADGVNQVIIHRRRNICPANLKARKITGQIRGQRETVRFNTETYGSESRHSAYMRPGVDRHSMLTASKYLDLNGHSVVSDVRGGFLKTNVVPDWVELDVIHPDDSAEEQEYDVTLTGIMRSLLALSQAPFPTEYSDMGKIISPNLLSIEDDLWHLYCDIRAMTNNGQEVKTALEQALADKVEIFSLRVDAGAGFVRCDPESKLIRSAEWALQKEGIRYKLMEGFGASDSRYFAGTGVELFDFGPRGANLHGPNEWVSISSLKENAGFFYSLVEVLSRNPSSL
ncbi:MAG: M20/M25/M40 family metallo-hydrolase [Candidatus Thorarchaeota archaeon]